MAFYFTFRFLRFIFMYFISQNNITSAFAKMQAILSENYDTEQQLLIACPTPEQISVLLSSTLLTRKISTSSTFSAKDVQENLDERVGRIVGQNDS